jgi:shikimate dehydrogenase
MGARGGSPLVEESWIRPGQVVFDFVYHPRHTPLLDAAARRGATTIDGVALLVSQASLSFEKWTGRTFDVVEMAAAVDATMGANE